MRSLIKVGLAALLGTMLCATAEAQDGALVPPADNMTAESVLGQVQAKVNSVQTMQATLEFDEKDKDDSKKKKKKPADAGSKPAGANPKWPEPPGRDVERGPIFIKRGVGAYLMLQRKEKALEYIANGSTLWKYDHKDKEAKFVPSSWPIVNTFVSNALVMNVFVAMDSDSIKYRGIQNVEGESCWVVEGQSPSKLTMLGAEQIKLKMWIGQTDGIPRLIHSPGKDDMFIRLKNVKINEPVDESKFQFSVPAGVEQKNILGF